MNQSINQDGDSITYHLRFANIETNIDFLTYQVQHRYFMNLHKNVICEWWHENGILSYKDIKNRERLEFICALLLDMGKYKNSFKPVDLSGYTNYV